MTGPATPLTYRSAGVDLEKYEDAMGRLPALMKRTHTARVIPLNDAFAGLFRLNHSARPGQSSYQDPVLVSGTDGVGTKLKVAFLTGRFDTVGIDLVAMSVNDCLCLGAEPLFFLDYLAMGRDNPALIEDLVRGVSRGCEASNLSLLGGETAIMPDIYSEGEFDMAGFCVGVVERSRIIDGKGVRPGDAVIGIGSSGFHSNGYSLLRKVLFEHAGLQINSPSPLQGKSVGDVLMEPTRLYVKPVLKLLNEFHFGEGISGLAHITGGGLRDNIERFLPDDVRVIIHRNSWQVPAEFDWVRELGSIDREEMFRVFNMGIGFVVIVRAPVADRVRQMLVHEGLDCWLIGEVRSGEKGVEYQG